MGKMFDINENDEIDMSQLTSQHELDSINQRQVMSDKQTNSLFDMEGIAQDGSKGSRGSRNKTKF